MFVSNFLREKLKSAWFAGCIALAAWTVPATAQAAPTVLDFEDLPAGTIVRTQYSNRGVLFNFAFLSNAALFSPNTVAHSGMCVLRVCNVQDCGEFNSGPMVINFSSPQRRVKMFAGAEGAPLVGTLRAFDANGVQVGQVDGPKTVAQDVFNTLFEVTTAGAQISRVELLYENSAFEAIDDLEFDGEPPPPPPATAPVVQITSPINGSADRLRADRSARHGIRRGAAFAGVFHDGRNTSAGQHRAALSLGDGIDRYGHDPQFRAARLRNSSAGTDHVSRRSGERRRVKRLSRRHNYQHAGGDPESL